MAYLGLNLQEQVLKNKCDIEELKSAVAPVLSVNGKDGAVVLDASDINLRNGPHTTIESNINRIDEALDGKLDASKTDIAAVGGLVVPTVAPTDDVLVGVTVGRDQQLIYIGDGLYLYNGTLYATLPSDVDQEEWTFTLDDDTTVTKKVLVWTGA